MSSIQTKTKSHSSHSSHHKSSSSSKPHTASSSTSSTSSRQYYLITEAPLRATTETAEIDLQAESWKLPYSIDDSDLTFDGKPLNMLYEENRWMAEHHVSGTHDYHYSSSSSGSSSSGSGKEHKSRGRSRQSKK